MDILVLPAENITDVNYMLVTWKLCTKSLQKWVEYNAFNLQKKNGVQPKSILTTFLMNFQIICCVLVCKHWEIVSLREWVQKKQTVIQIVSVKIELFQMNCTLDQGEIQRIRMLCVSYK